MASRGARKAFTALKLIGLLTIAGVLAAGFLLPYAVGAGMATKAEADRFLNTKCDLQESAVQQRTQIYASDGKTLLATLFDQNRQVVPLGAVPVTARKALIDTEDRRFYEHHGVDPRGMLRALLSESGGSTQGASTLTQQYVKQVRYYQATTDAERNAAIQQNLDRKIYEAKCAISLEKKYSKDQILEKYFNIAYFGEHSYGIATAAKTYFNVTPQKLTIPQAAVLVGLVKNPTLYDPYQNRTAALERRNTVIQNMADQGDITQAAADKYTKAPLKLATNAAPTPEQGCAYANPAIKNGGFFCDYLLDWLQDIGGLSLDGLNTGGYKIITTLDAPLQNAGQAAVWKKYSASQAETVVSPSVDPKTGAVKTMITSKYYNWGDLHSKDKRYTSNRIFSLATAGAGSTYKYFSLIAALTAGMKPTQTLTTSSKYYPTNCPQNRDGTKDAYATNAGDYRNTMTLTDATVYSSNTFFVGLEDQLFDCDLSTIVGTARALGMDALNLPDATTKGKTTAQATVDEGRFTFTLGQNSTSPLQLTSAYGAAANDGSLCRPNPVVSITKPNGAKLKYSRPACVQVMSPWVARTAIKILIGDTIGLGTASGSVAPFYNSAGFDDHKVASKTGTNNAAFQSGPERGKDNGKNSAIWFVGLTPRLVSATSLFNIDHPTKTLDIAGNDRAGDDTFGAFAGRYWVAAYGKYLASTSWQWPSPDDIPNGKEVPTYLVGQSESQVVSTLTQDGFKPKRYPIPCGSNYLQGTVAYIGPGVAAPGQTVFYCVSNGKRLSAPPPAKKKTKTKSDSSSSNGGGNSSPRRRGPR